MRLKRVTSLLLVFLVCFVVFSCKSSKNDDASNSSGVEDNSGSNTPAEALNIVWSDTIAPAIIRSQYDTDASHLEAYEDFRDALYDLLNRHSTFASDDIISEENEIVLGDTQRKISADAKKILDEKIALAKRYYEEEAPLEEVIGYTIYSSGGSLAIVWSFDTLYSVALDYFIENYLTGSVLELDEGYSKTVILTRSEHFAALEEKIYDEAWASLGAAIDDKYSADIVDAMQTLYSIYTDDMYLWLANLYDPEVGGFYHSNSARDTIGFLPDIESTSTALSFITTTKMKSGYFGDHIPDWMKEQVGAFVSSLQEADGYFYHPQWGHNVTTSRLGRDLSSAQALLRACGISPIYSYPGSSAKSTSLTLPLSSSSSVVSVSRFASVSDSATPERFRSAENWQKYLDDNAALIKEGKQDFYVFGNTLQSQLTQMADFGKKYGVNYKKLTTDFLTKHQDTETGFWSSELDYNATNGFHKISDVYNSAGVEIPNADRAIESTVAVMKSDLRIVAGVEVYNSWSCFGYIIKNIRNYATGTVDEREEKISSITEKVYEIAADAILASYEKISPLRKSDGSFSYGLLYSADSVQDAPAAVPNTFEGDINGNALACTSLVTHIYSALDLSSYMVPLFTEVDYILYIEELAAKSGVIKDELNTEKVVFDFEDCKEGDDAPADFAYNVNGGELTIATLGDDDNKVLSYTCPGGSNPTIDFPINKLSATPNHAVFEFDVYYESGTGHEFLLLGSAGNILQVYTVVNGNTVILKNKGESTSVLATFKVRTLNRLRFEYFWEEGYLAVYLNDSEYPAGITETVLSSGKHQPLTSVHLGAAKAMLGTTYFDNISLSVDHKSKDDSKKPSLKPLESVTYDFEEAELGTTDIYPLGNDTSRGGSITVAALSDNKVLSYLCSNSPDTSNPSLVITANPTSREPNMAVFEMKVMFGDCALSTLYIHTSTQIGYFEFRISGENVIMTNGNEPDLVLLRADKDRFFTLRMEYYWTEGYFAIYKDDAQAPICTKLLSDGKSHAPLQKIEFIANRSSTGAMMLDDIKFDLGYVDDVPKYTAPPEPESVVYDFEDSNVGDTDIYPFIPSSGRGGELYIDEDNSGNKFLKYVCSDEATSTNPLFKVKPNAISKTPNFAVIEMDLFFKSGEQLVLNIYNTSGGVTYYNIRCNGTEIFIEDGSNNNFKLTKTAYSEKVKLKVVYYWTEGYFAITLREEKTVYTTAIKEGKSHLPLRDIDVYSDKVYAGVIGIDNLVFDTDYIESPPEMPKPESVVHTFDDAIFDTSYFSINDQSGTRGGIVSAKVDESGDGYLEYACSDSSTTPNPELTIYPNKMYDHQNAVHIEIELYFEDLANLYLTFYTSSGSINYYEFKPSGENILICDYANSNSTLFSLNRYEVIKLKIWYYPTAGLFEISLGDGEAVYASTLLANKSHGILTRIGMYSDKRYTGTIRLDNIVFDTLYLEEIPEFS